MCNSKRTIHNKNYNKNGNEADDKNNMVIIRRMQVISIQFLLMNVPC